MNDELKRNLVTAAAAVGGLAAGVVLFGLVGAPAIGGAAGLFAYQMFRPGDNSK
jgi:hypothetical protein